MENFNIISANMQIDMQRQKKELDDSFSETGYLNFQDILQIFKIPISENQAWALCYQSMKYLSTRPTNMFSKISNFSQILLHKNGYVKIEPEKDIEKNSDETEEEMIFSLGILLFNALDYGLAEEEEINLCSQLQNLITFMTNLNKGYLHGIDIKLAKKNIRFEYERSLSEISPETSANPMSIVNIVRLMCVDHLQFDDDNEADIWYKDIIHSLVMEALELSYFLKEELTTKLVFNLDRNESHTVHFKSANKDSSDNRFQSWAYVIDELKKNNSSKILHINSNFSCLPVLNASSNSKLADRDIILDDIRNRRYCLKKISQLPHSLKKDAYSAILEFIRNKPHLKKVSDRQLPPLKREYNLHELLMESIKKPPRPLKCLHKHNLSSHCIIEKNKGLQLEKDIKKDQCNISDDQKVRKLIPVDFNFKFDDDDDEFSEGDDKNLVSCNFPDNAQHLNYKVLLRQNNYYDTKKNEHHFTNFWTGQVAKGIKFTDNNEYLKFYDSQLKSYDLATQCSSKDLFRYPCKKSWSHLILEKNCILHLKSETNDVNTTNSHLNLRSSRNKKPIPRPRSNLDNNDSVEDFKRSKKNYSSFEEMLFEDRFSLTLDEIVHIRSVLTEAELEALPMEGKVKEDVEKRRICFLCLKTRFGLLGPWGQRCKLCGRTICVKCYSKMKIPNEHFSRVPVILLSPSLRISPSSTELDSENLNKLWDKNTTTSAPTSPAPKCYASESQDKIYLKRDIHKKSNNRFLDNFGHHEERFTRKARSPSKPSDVLFGSFHKKNRDMEREIDRFNGLSIIVCHDCRMMVIQIIKTSRTTRTVIRNNVISRLTLNLSPVYF